MASYCLGIDVGGSHLSGAIYNTETARIEDGSYQSVQINVSGGTDEFNSCFGKLVEQILEGHNINLGSVKAVGIAMPGPFDYKNGISHIYGVKKFDSLFGVNIKLELARILNNLPVYFVNDAESFALGEYAAGAAANSSKSVILTLGTGFGSTFLDSGAVMSTSGNGVPPNGYLYDLPYKESIADDHFSTRWFVEQWANTNREAVRNVEDIAKFALQGDDDALTIFDTFAGNLAEFLLPWIASFKPEKLVIGGGIAKAAPLFADKLSAALNSENNVSVQICQLWDKAAIIGAATYAKNCCDSDLKATDEVLRKTQQYLAPVKKTTDTELSYDAYPSYALGDGKIQSGVAALAEWIIQHKTVVIDGYVGVFWDKVIEGLNTEMTRRGKSPRWHHTDAALKTEEELDTMLQPYLGGDDPLFGKITDKKLADWFDEEKFKLLQPDSKADLNILIGTGAALANWDVPLVYIDLPKNELQFRARAGVATNLGKKDVIDNRHTYKRFFFIDWVVLNNHKQEVLPKIDIMVDEQRPEEYLFIKGDDLRKGLTAMATNVFRPRPWFEPGAWGGTWMKEHMDGLNKEVANLAWSFELMVLENGLLFESDGYLLEVSFDCIMFNSYKEVLGDCAETFKYDFPIRFDFLDTFDGGNLSIQCHPSPDYIKEHFGMPFTQDETYYMLDCKKDPVVYLGFQEGVEPDEFHNALTYSKENTVELDVEKYIQKFTAVKHNLYLIPHGTIHASGSNSMVLEISSAPYIFTFKMYDWLRLDLDGKPRPLNIERGMANVNFERNGASVEAELISKPYVLTENSEGTIEHLPTHAKHFYDVHRYYLSNSMNIETNNKCHVWMIVEGQAVKVVTNNGVSQIFNYAETFVIPASAKSYTIQNVNPGEKLMLVKAFVK
jgi:predicted NBD/HSP70 family sugar kinase/mannose-6-phosphate isomerase class I